jgi:hypothetical protein
LVAEVLVIMSKYDPTLGFKLIEAGILTCTLLDSAATAAVAVVDVPKRRAGSRGEKCGCVDDRGATSGEGTAAALNAGPDAPDILGDAEPVRVS